MSSRVSSVADNLTPSASESGLAAPVSASQPTPAPVSAPGPAEQPSSPPVPLAGAKQPAFFVGIGSSAGGLEALTALLPGLPTGLGLRYVVVQHMSPTHRSMMAQLLGRTTAMEVLEVTNGCVPLPDKVYVTPPNNNVELREDGALYLLQPPNETVPKPSVNLFFTSMAQAVGDRAIGVVLSGTGSDGAVGLHAIKSAGGYSFAQEPGEAKYDGMVRSAIEAGGVDWVLPAEGIGAEVARIVQRQWVAQGLATTVEGVPPATLQALLHALYAQTRIDFTGYKEATLLRRIERRMISTGCLKLEQYVEHTRQNPKELHLLSQDMLISVTSFFRDRVAFDRLREELQRLLEHKATGEDFRVWVAGCASGEEAYSVAMMVHDLLLAHQQPLRVQIFATDIDESALVRARRGVYPASLMTDLQPSVLDRHFVPHADGFEVSKALRGMVMFARHNMVQDPPFVRLDLVSCRNVLIYLQNPLQERMMRTFIYALNPGGLLFLGRSEGIHSLEGSFEVISREAHLFKRVAGTAFMPRQHGREADNSPARAAGRVSHLGPEEWLTRAIAERFAPASVLVDEAGEVQHFKGDLEGLLTLPSGRPGFNLMSLVRRELRAELARLMRSALQAEPGPPVSDGLLAAQPVAGRWRINRSISKNRALRLSVQRLTVVPADVRAGAVARPKRVPASPQLLLVCFERRPLAEMMTATVAERDEVGSQAQTALEEELATTREHLYTVIEELETANEESQSLNEEIQTANEELQSTNEELEASNEELQASNEELTTVNEELQVKSLEWQALNSELEGIYASMDFPLLAFDENMVLRRINRAVFRQLGLDATWLGKPLGALPWPAGMPDLLPDFLEVQSQGLSRARQVLNMGARHWALRMMPRQASGGARGGVLLHLEDVTQMRESELSALRNAALLRELVERSAQLMCLCDPSGRLLVANPEFARCHGLDTAGAVGSLLSDLLPLTQARAFREAQIEAMRELKPMEREEQLVVDGLPRDLLASYYPLFDDAGAVTGVCYQAIDVTRRKQAERALLAANSAKLAAESLARTKGSFLANMSHEIRTPMNAVVGLSRMVLEGELPETARDQIGKVHEAALALTRVLDDVLDYSKMDAGEMRFELRPFNLHEVLLGVKNLFLANASQKGLQIHLDLPLGVPLGLVGDALRLSQVLNNLVSNALKFTQQGSIRIAAAPNGEADNGRCSLRFSVRDTGIGVAHAVRDALFDPFVQGDETVTRRFGGTGLGLAICRRLVDLMGGRIGVDSEPGQGSEFWFVVAFEVATDVVAPARPPSGSGLAASAASPSDKARAQTLLGKSLKQALGGGRFLLAEDNALNQIVGRAVLERMGLVVEVVEDGQQALDLINRHPVGHFQAVLMDMHMPVLDGLAATRRLRQTPQGQPLVVVALTAAALTEDRERCLQAGMDGHTAKPLVPEQLVDELLSIARQRRYGGGRVDPAGDSDDAPVAASARPSAGPPKVPGFDLRPLFERLQRNELLVWQLLEEFVAREGVTAAELEQLMREQKLDAARKRSHALMGSAVTIGATLVARTTAGLEAALGEGMATPSMLKSVSEALAASLASAQKVLANRKP